MMCYCGSIIRWRVITVDHCLNCLPPLSQEVGDLFVWLMKLYWFC